MDRSDISGMFNRRLLVILYPLSFCIGVQGKMLTAYSIGGIQRCGVAKAQKTGADSHRLNHRFADQAGCG